MGKLKELRTAEEFFGDVESFVDNEIEQQYRARPDTNGESTVFEIVGNVEGEFFSDIRPPQTSNVYHDTLVLIGTFSVYTDWDSEMLLDEKEEKFLRPGYYYDEVNDEYYSFDEDGHRVEVETWVACDEEAATQYSMTWDGFPVTVEQVIDREAVEKLYRSHVNHVVQHIEPDDGFDKDDLQRLADLYDYLEKESIEHLYTINDFKKAVAMFK